jgi:IS5 family transposase
VTLRRFCLFGDGDVPVFKTFQDNIKKLSPESLEAVNQALLAVACKKKVEAGSVVRIDCTAVETNIHYPTDNSLLWDGARVATRLIQEACQEFLPGLRFPNRLRIVKRLHFRIVNAKGKHAVKKRLQAFRRLFGYGEEVLAALREVAAALGQVAGGSPELKALHNEIGELEPLFAQVLNQGKRRVLEGEKLPAGEKVFSIFEPHTDIIEKGDRDPVFGHKICLETGKSGLILSCQIPRGNPADSSLFEPALDLHEAQYGKSPRQTAADGGFASKANLREAEWRNTSEVFFTKGKGRNGEPLMSEMSAWIRKKLARFRAGIEGNISTLKRAFGLTRCTWEGWRSFQSYVWAAILGYNLSVLARLLS